MSNNQSFWGRYVAQPVKESRFGIIPMGEHSVRIIDVQPLMASHSFRLGDDGKITDVTVKDKDKFDPAFDQEILAIVYQDVDGRVLIDRRSSKGWLKNDDRYPEDKDGHKKGDLVATPMFCQQYGLRAGTGKNANKFLKADGSGMQSGNATKSCLEIVDRLCSACEVQSPLQLMDMQLDIQVIEKPAPEGKTNTEVKAYAKLGTGFKTKATTVGATPQAVKPAPAIAVLEPANDDLPF